MIMSLPPKSCELDPLPAHLFHQCLEYIIDFITLLVNKSLQSGTIILSWKTSILCPLIKGHTPAVSPQNTKNFRPVSNVPFLSKVLEKCALHQLINTVQKITYCLITNLHIVLVTHVKLQYPRLYQTFYGQWRSNP